MAYNVIDFKHFYYQLNLQIFRNLQAVNCYQENLSELKRNSLAINQLEVPFYTPDFHSTLTSFL